MLLLPISHIAPNNENRIDELIKTARAKVIKTIETRLKIKNFEELIETETINDPRTWQTKVTVFPFFDVFLHFRYFYLSFKCDISLK